MQLYTEVQLYTLKDLYALISLRLLCNLLTFLLWMESVTASIIYHKIARKLFLTIQTYISETFCLNLLCLSCENLDHVTNTFLCSTYYAVVVPFKMTVTFIYFLLDWNIRLMQQNLNGHQVESSFMIIILCWNWQCRLRLFYRHYEYLIS